jgi:tRNA pseudouridine38-40 synthase
MAIKPLPMRFFIELSYSGTRYCGWQRQPNGLSVQESLETALSTILREKIDLTGCGRTDTGVHARYYVAHFDCSHPLPPTFVQGMNSLLPPDIALFSATEVAAEAHARFDAYERSYAYHITLRKDPFATEQAWHYVLHHQLDLQKMADTAALLTRFQAFAPFCKSHSGMDEFDCLLKTAYWDFQPEQHRYVFHISANRFLRGMVRLIVGACIHVGTGKLRLEEVQYALESQTPLKKNLSVPPQGLFLTGVKYPEKVFIKG